MCQHFSNIPKVIQKLRVWQGGCANFLSGAIDHYASTRHSRRQRICCIANADKNQFLNHFRYTVCLRESIYFKTSLCPSTGANAAESEEVGSNGPLVIS